MKNVTRFSPAQITANSVKKQNELMKKQNEAFISKRLEERKENNLSRLNALLDVLKYAQQIDK